MFRILLVLITMTLGCSSVKPVSFPVEVPEPENIAILPISSARSMSAPQGEAVYGAIASYTMEIIKKYKLNYSIIERIDLDSILEEFKLQDSGMTDAKTLVEFGKLKNIQILIYPSFVFDNVSKNNFVSLKMVDTRTGKTTAMSSDMAMNYGIDEAIRYIIKHATYELFGFGYKIGLREKFARGGLF